MFSKVKQSQQVQPLTLEQKSQHVQPLTLEQKSQQFIEHIVNGRLRAAKELLASVNAQDRNFLLTTSYTVTDRAGRTFKGVTALQYAVWALDVDMWEMLLSQLPEQEAKNQIQDMYKVSWIGEHKLHANWNLLIAVLQDYIDLVNKETVGAGIGFPMCNISRHQKLDFVNKLGNEQKLLPLNVIQDFSKPFNTPVGTRSEITTTKIDKVFGSRRANWHDNYVAPLLGPVLTLGNGVAYFRGSRNCPRWGRIDSINPPSSYATRGEGGNATIHHTEGKHYSLIAADKIVYQKLYDSRMKKYNSLMQNLGLNRDLSSSSSPGLNK